jgi:hypothetical protein
LKIVQLISENFLLIIFVTIQPYINVIGRINNPVLFNDTYLLNLDETDGNRISMKKYTMNEHN